MAIGAIPMPMTGIEAFDESQKVMQQRLDSIRMNAYRNNSLKIEQAKADRENQLLPSQLQEYADKHNLSKYQIQELQSKIADAQHDRNIESMLLGGGNNISSGGQSAPPSTYNRNAVAQPIDQNDPNAGVMPVGNINQPPVNSDQANKAPQQAQMTQPNNVGSDPYAALKAKYMAMKGITPMPNNQGGMTPAPDMMPQDNPDDNRQALPPRVDPVTTTQNKLPQPTPVDQQTPNDQPPGKSYPKNPGDRMEISPGNPRFYMLDALPPGTKIGKHITISAPKIDKGNDGVDTVTMPSGRTFLYKTGLSNEEKVNLNLDAAQQRENLRQKNREELATTKLNNVTAQKSYDTAKELVNAANEYQKMYGILTKSDHPLQTGWGTGLSTGLNFSNDKDAAIFKESATKAVGSLGKYLANRPGAAVLGMASGAKPGLWKQPEFNKGMIESSYQDIKTKFDNEKAEYEKSTGKKFPIELPNLGNSAKRLKWNPQTQRVEEQ